MTAPGGLTFRNARGVTVDLNDGATHDLFSLSGVGAPPTDAIAEPAVSGGGRRLYGMQVRPRTLNALIEIRPSGGGYADQETQRDALASALAATLGGGQAEEGELTLSRENGDVRKLRCTTHGLGFPAQNYRGSYYRVPLVFVASHPYWYGAEVTDALTIGAAGALRFHDPAASPTELGFPAGFGLDNPSALKTIAYTGTAETRSLLWSVPGPSTAPELRNATTGYALRFVSTFTVPTGITLKVRMGWRPDGIQSLLAWLEDDLGLKSDSQLGFLAAGWRPVYLQPGNNRIIASQTNTDTVTHTVQHYPEYVAA